MLPCHGSALARAWAMIMISLVEIFSTHGCHNASCLPSLAYQGKQEAQ